MTHYPDPRNYALAALLPPRLLSPVRAAPHSKHRDTARLGQAPGPDSEDVTSGRTCTDWGLDLLLRPLPELSAASEDDAEEGCSLT